jgi:hypothetical protein
MSNADVLDILATAPASVPGASPFGIHGAPFGMPAALLGMPGALGHTATLSRCG